MAPNVGKRAMAWNVSSSRGCRGCSRGLHPALKRVHSARYGNGFSAGGFLPFHSGRLWLWLRLWFSDRRELIAFLEFRREKQVVMMPDWEYSSLTSIRISFLFAATALAVAAFVVSVGSPGRPSVGV